MNAQYSYAHTGNVDCEFAFSSFPCQDKVSRSLEESLEIKEKSLKIEQEKLGVAQESLKVGQESLSVGQESLTVQKNIMDQNKEIIDLTSGLWKLARGAEITFFIIPTPYYISQFSLHFFSDDYLQATPNVKAAILMGSFALGFVLSQIDIVDKFRNHAKEMVKPPQIAEQAFSVVTNKNSAQQTSSLFEFAGRSLTAFVKNIPNRCSNKIKEIFKKEL